MTHTLRVTQPELCSSSNTNSVSKAYIYGLYSYAMHIVMAYICMAYTNINYSHANLWLIYRHALHTRMYVSLYSYGP